MSNGAQVNVIDKEGKSPMDYAEDLKEGSEMIAILKGNRCTVMWDLLLSDLSFLILSRRTAGLHM